MEWFADTWFYVALLDRRDAHHRYALSLNARIPHTRSIVTHDGVLTELLAHFSDDGPVSRANAVAAVRYHVRNAHVVSIDRELFLLGLDRYAARPDKEWSHVDCLSMVLMEQRGIQHVLSNDHHFSQAGFTLVNQ